MTSSFLILIWLWILTKSVFSTQLQVPALGRIFYDIGSLYDERSGNFLPREIRLVSEETLKNSNSNSNSSLVDTVKLTDFSRYQIPIVSPSVKIVSHFNTEGYYYDRISTRALFGLLDFPRNGSAGFLHEKWTEDEMKNPDSDFYLLNKIIKIQKDELLIPFSKNKTKSKIKSKSASQWKKLRNLRKSPNFIRMKKEISLNIRKFQEKFPKILKRATHVVVGVERGDQLSIRFKPKVPLKRYLDIFNLGFPFSYNQSMISSSQLFSDILVRDETIFEAENSNLNSNSNKNKSINSDSNSVDWKDIKIAIEYHTKDFVQYVQPGGVPLYFDLMPIKEFIKSLRLKFPLLFRPKFGKFPLRRDPISGSKYRELVTSLDETWKILNGLYRLEAKIQQCLDLEIDQSAKKSRGKGKGGKILKRVEKVKTLRDEFLPKFRQYKKDVRNLLKRTSSGSKKAHELWKFHYTNSTGLFKSFQRTLKKTKEEFYHLLYSRKPTNSQLFYLMHQFENIRNSLKCAAILNSIN